MRLHHLQKKSHRKHIRLPLSHKKHIFVDGLALFASVASPIMTLPQVITIYATKGATGVSVATWGSYIGLSAIWVFYGAIHKEKAVFLSGFLGIFIDIAIVVGVMRT